MIISYGGQDYPFDLDKATIKQALAIEEYMKCSFDEWGKKLMAGGDLRARQALGWLILHPDGGVPVGDTDFEMMALGKALDAAYAAEAPAEPEAGPTGAAAASNGHPSPAASSPASSPPSSAAISP